MIERVWRNLLPNIPELQRRHLIEDFETFAEAINIVEARYFGDFCDGKTTFFKQGFRFFNFQVQIIVVRRSAVNGFKSAQ